MVFSISDWFDIHGGLDCTIEPGYTALAAKVRDAGLTEKDLDIMLEMHKKAKELSGE